MSNQTVVRGKSNKSYQAVLSGEKGQAVAAVAIVDRAAGRVMAK